MYSVLHISDLHRSPSDPISNDELLSTLLADRDKYVREDPPIAPPEAIVISGDLVQGVPMDMEPTAAADELRSQYASALEFVSRLTASLVNGQRARVILVPGNHDVAWGIAKSAMTRVDDQSDLSPDAFGPETDLRWSWSDRCIYRIVDREAYEKRFAPYREFIKEFYDGVVLAYPLETESYFQLFELFDGRVGVAGFNSCSGNDCFSSQGAIPEQALAQAHLGLRDKEAGYDLLVAVWHHNVEGAPHTSDYMDVSAVYRMIGKGFRLGLHGHQHRSEMMQRYIHLPEQAPMAVVSAGSLCAGRRELPIGVNRQYNILELNEELAAARVHVREMAIATVFGQGRRTEFGGKSFVDLDWGNARLQSARLARERDAVLQAERHLRQGDFSSAVTALESLDPEPDTYARSLLLQALIEGKLWKEAIRILDPPRSVADLTLLVRAAAEMSDFDGAGSLLSEHGPRVGMSAPALEDLHELIRAKKALADG
jgi:hypothetical protein